MVKIAIYHDSPGSIVGCKVVGHAGYAKSGKDIVCAAVSILVYTTASAMQQLLDIKLSGDLASGKMEFYLPDAASAQTELLFKTMLLGLAEIARQYPKRVRISEERR